MRLAAALRLAAARPRRGASSFAAAAPAPPAPSRAEVLRAMNERLLLVRRLERAGLRRCLLACGAFLAYKVLRARVFGGGAGGAPGGAPGGGAAAAAAAVVLDR